MERGLLNSNNCRFSKFNFRFFLIFSNFRCPRKWLTALLISITWGEGSKNNVSVPAFRIVQQRHRCTKVEYTRIFASISWIFSMLNLPPYCSLMAARSEWILSEVGFRVILLTFGGILPPPRWSFNSTVRHPWFKYQRKPPSPKPWWYLHSGELKSSVKSAGSFSSLRHFKNSCTFQHLAASWSCTLMELLKGIIPSYTHTWATKVQISKYLRLHFEMVGENM